MSDWYDARDRIDRSPVLRGTAEPAALTVELGLLPQGEIRPSTREKDRVIRHINDAFAAGRLTEEQAEARREAVDGIQARSHLGRITADLPAMPPRSGTDHVKSNPEHIGWAGLVSMLLGAAICAVTLAASVRPAWAEGILSAIGLWMFVGGTIALGHAVQRVGK